MLVGGGGLGKTTRKRAGVLSRPAYDRFSGRGSAVGVCGHFIWCGESLESMGRCFTAESSVERMGRVDNMRWTVFSVFVVSLAAYIYTLCPTIFVEGSGELIGAAYGLCFAGKRREVVARTFVPIVYGMRGFCWSCIKSIRPIRGWGLI